MKKIEHRLTKHRLHNNDKSLKNSQVGSTCSKLIIPLTNNVHIATENCKAFKVCMTS